MLYVEMIAKGPSRDAHSSLAVLIENPAWTLIRALDTLRDGTGKILVKDWYNEVRSFTSEELALINEPFDEQKFKQEYNLSNFVNNVSGIEIVKALSGMPTCNIAGFVAGYSG